MMDYFGLDLDPFYVGATGAVAVALAVTIVVLRDALLDLAAVKRLGIGNGRRTIARAGVRGESVRVGIILLLATVTVSRALRGPAPDDLGLFAIIPRLAMAVIAGVLAVDSVIELRYRISLRTRHRTQAEIDEDDPDTIDLETEEAFDAV